MKKLFIIRGLPGSGKTTFALSINASVFEADTFFIGPKGTYQYDASKISDAHKWCRDSVESAMKRGEDRIAVSNTFVRRWEMEAYIILAHMYDYMIHEITMSGPTRRNEHGVPDMKIKEMKERWEQ